MSKRILMARTPSTVASPVRAVAAGVAVVLAVLAAVPLRAAASTRAQSASSSRARIVANPSSVMVNTATQLSGKGFGAKKTITIAECAATEWVVTQNVCVTTNEISVTTDSRGRFRHSMTVQTCAASSGSPGFSQTCYVGERLPQGIDTEELLGAVSITVTGP